jgi:NCAIR mutase (PurE)-related protein
MTPDAIRDLLERTARGDVSVGAAFDELKSIPFRDLGFARLDSHRELRSGIPEVIYAEGKHAEQIIEITRAMMTAGQGVLVTRLDAGKADVVCGAIAELRYNALARTARCGAVASEPVTDRCVAVVSAGTADQAVAEEALETLAFLSVPSLRFNDVGVAGIHRLLASRDEIALASVVVVVAGMEGALPSVVGGLMAQPVIAVPTSVGYGASFGGLAALLAMLNSCAAGVTVVNIDNGFGAAVAASRINHLP